MKFTGALVKLDEMVVAVAVDSADFLQLPQEERLKKNEALSKRFSQSTFCDALRDGKR